MINDDNSASTSWRNFERKPKMVSSILFLNILKRLYAILNQGLLLILIS